MVSTIVNLIDPLLALVYPQRCAVCKTLGEPVLCARCAAAIAPVPEPLCARCGQALGEAAACRHCTRRSPAFDAARALGAHDGVLQHAIHLLKYRDRPKLAEPLGVLLTEYLRGESVSMGGLAFDVVTSTPMHPSRRRVRGYDQAERLGRVVARELGVAYHPTLLRRTRPTRAQVGLAQAARQENLANAFAADSVVPGAVVLIVDDVSTTGSTLHECARALKAAGAKSVYGLTLAAG